MPNYSTSTGYNITDELRYRYTDEQIEAEYKRRRNDKDIRHAAALGLRVAEYRRYRDYILENDPR